MSDEEKLINIIENNVNVGKRNDGQEFLILIAGFLGFCLFIFLFADTFANIFIDRMSDKMQMKIENAISFSTLKYNSCKDSSRITVLNDIKDEIVALDKNIQNKSSFKIREINDKNINAFILPNGEIYITSALLDKVKEREALTFVLAHELGHYAHRDHLKSISRDIISAAIMSIVTMGQKDLNIATSSITNMSGLTYSRKQEKNADKYANKVVLILYGSNDGATKFFEYLRAKENMPEFMKYFLTHPHTEDRIRYLKKNNSL